MRFIGLALLRTALAHAQNITGTITGVVEDPADAKIVGAVVSALHLRIPASPTRLHHRGRRLRPALLPLGHYEVTTETQGSASASMPSTTIGAPAAGTITIGNAGRTIRGGKGVCPLFP